MGAWTSDSMSHVSHMTQGDFCANEKSTTIETAGNLRVEFVGTNGEIEILKEAIPVLEKEVIDTTVLSKRALISFLEDQIADAKAKGVLFSVHMKATMMKVSDPIIFGHVVTVFFKDLFAKHGQTFKELGVDVNNGFGDL